ncbi:MAG: NAD-dependent epimerase/dehydratase family protein [Actinobacteria bacterium]|nr:NAD-dependent epimerase/dehydratase family protein [Actinomycetota bacterium]
MARVLVTGGAGFIGSNLVAALLERGDEVRILDNFSTGRRENLAGIEGEVEIVEGDLRSYERVHAAVRGAEVVFHQGALPSVPRSVQDPLTTTAVNVEGTLNVLLAARDEGVRRVVNASSSSVYGQGGTLPRREEQPVAPVSPYAVAKLAAERFCTSFFHVYGLETVSLRYFNVFGPRQNPHSQYAAVVPLFIESIAADRPIAIDGDGEQSRDFTFVANVVDANLKAVAAPTGDGVIVNVATGSSRTVNELAAAIGRILDRTPRVERREPRAGDVRDSLADVSLARATLAYEVLVEFEDGLERTIEAMLPER